MRPERERVEVAAAPKPIMPWWAWWAAYLLLAASFVGTALYMSP